MKTIYRENKEPIDTLIRRYRRARERDGIKEVLREKEAYIKPSEKKRRKHAEAIRNQRKERR